MTRRSIQLFMIGSALALLASAANAGQDLVTVKDLDPFTHVVRIPADAEQSSIRFEQVKLIKIPTKVRVTENARYCGQLAFRDPGGSSYCPSAALEDPTAAYEVIYSYNVPRIFPSRGLQRGHAKNVLGKGCPIRPCGRFHSHDFQRS